MVDRSSKNPSATHFSSQVAFLAANAKILFHLNHSTAIGVHIENMVGYTEPLIAVMGHPVAGNPSQFAIECALRLLGLEYRVTSFDISLDKLAAALGGLDVLGFHGVLVDESLAPAVGEWWLTKRVADNSQSDAFSAPIHTLFRSPDDKDMLSGCDSLSAWLIETTNAHFQEHETTITDTLWLGARDNSFPSEIQSENEMMLATRTPPIESVQQANLIVLAPGPKKDVRLDADEWPENDGSTLVVDLTTGHEELSVLKNRGYATLSRQSRQVGIIAQSLHRWTGQSASETIIREAIEEYLGV